MNSRNYVAYYRVSTKRQGESGLGLEAQKATVAYFLNNAKGKLVAEFQEIESGTRKGNTRPQLKLALDACQIYGGTLVIAKLDRLYRNVFMVSQLQESGVEFVCCDNPTLGKSMIQIMSVFAEMEADKISERTREALLAKRFRGEPTGASCWKSRRGVLSPSNQKIGRELAIKQIRKKSREFCNRMAPVIAEIIDETPEITAYGIAKKLTSRGIPTSRRHVAWSVAAVKNLIIRLQQI